MLPPSARSRAGKAVELSRVRAVIAKLHAYEAALVVGLAADGTLHVTTPSGIARTSRPPGMHLPRAPAHDPPPF